MTALAKDNQLVLPFLGLLAEQPRTMGELIGYLGPGSRYEHLKPHTGTVYTLMLALEESHWIERDHDPAKSGADRLCRITAAGLAELRERVDDAITDASWSSGHAFVTALPFLFVFSGEQAAGLIATRVRNIKQRQEQFQRYAGREQRSKLTKAKDDYLDSRSRWEIDWLDAYGRRLENGDLAEAFAGLDAIA